MGPTKPSLDKAYKELQNIVKEFEDKEIDLETSIPKFKKGLELAKFLEDKLTKIKNEVQEIKVKFESSES
jgi:exodeoxyribonuclease VII small subunit